MSTGTIIRVRAEDLEKAVIEYLYHTKIIGRPHDEAQDIVMFRHKNQWIPNLSGLARRYSASGRPHIESIKTRRSRSPNAV